MPRGVPKAGKRKLRATTGVDKTLHDLTAEITRKANNLKYHQLNHPDDVEEIRRREKELSDMIEVRKLYKQHICFQK